MSSFLLIRFYFFLSGSLISTFLSSTSLILSSASLILLLVPFRLFFNLIYCIIHYILQDPCQHWRGILRFRHRIHTRSYAPASKGEESREAPEQLAWGLAFPEATRAGPWCPHRKLRAPAATRKIQEVLPSRRNEAHLPRGV